jgi:hypothetical protein
MESAGGETREPTISARLLNLWNLVVCNRSSIEGIRSTKRAAALSYLTAGHAKGKIALAI